jgi:hypothetical protein
MVLKTCPCNPKKVQLGFVGNAFSVRNEKVIETGNLVRKPIGKQSKTTVGRN